MKLPDWCGAEELTRRLGMEYGVILKSGDSFEGGGGRGFFRKVWRGRMRRGWWRG